MVNSRVQMMIALLTIFHFVGLRWYIPCFWSGPNSGSYIKLCSWLIPWSPGQLCRPLNNSQSFQTRLQLHNSKISPISSYLLPLYLLIWSNVQTTTLISGQVILIFQAFTDHVAILNPWDLEAKWDWDLVHLGENGDGARWDGKLHQGMAHSFLISLLLLCIT